jgi:hypothetical protein
MRRKFYMHKRAGVFYACLVNQENGLPMSARSTGERDRDAALIVVSGTCRERMENGGGWRPLLTLPAYCGLYEKRS